MTQDQAPYEVDDQQVEIKNESNDHKYFIITPRIVKAYSRTPYDLALWDTIKDIAGEGGECYLSTADLATLSGMSAGQAHLSRKYWIKIGFLKGEVKRDPGYPQPVWHITVPDLWQKNITWCEKYPKIKDRIAFRHEHKSLQKSIHPVKATREHSPSEEGTTPSELKNTNKEDHGFNVNERTALLCKLYSANIGAMLPLLAEQIKDAAVEFPDSTWYEEAFKIAVSKNVRPWNFVYKVLLNWKEKGRGWTPEKKYSKPGRSSSATQPAGEDKHDYDALRRIMLEQQAKGQKVHI